MTEQTLIAQLKPANDTIQVEAKRDAWQAFAVSGSEHPATSADTNQTQQRPDSFFTGHLLRPDHFGRILPRAEAPEWIGFTIIFSLFLITLMRTFYPRKFGLLLSSLFSARKFGQFVRESGLGGNLLKHYLLLNAFIVIGLVAYFVARDIFRLTGFMGEGFTFYLALSLLCAFVFTVELLILVFLGRVFRIAETSHAMILQFYMQFIVSGIVLLPFVAGAAYGGGWASGTILLSGIGLAGLLWVYRILRWTVLVMEKPGFMGIYFFLYLCTLEIIPLLIAIQYLQTY